MTDPVLAAQRAEESRGRWGVWDQHRREWAVAPVHVYEKDAAAAKLDVLSLWPWELEVREDKRPAEPEKFATCPECLSSGVCDSCDRDCTRCDGSTVVPIGELAEHEKRRLIRLGYMDAPASAPSATVDPTPKEETRV